MAERRQGLLIVAVVVVLAIAAATVLASGPLGAANGNDEPSVVNPRPPLTDGPDSPVSSSPDQIRVPNLVGMTVAAANRRLRKAGLRPETGTVLRGRPGGGGPLRRGDHAGRRVTVQSPPAGSFTMKRSPVALGTAGEKSAMPVAGLEELAWHSTAFRKGVLTLGGLGQSPFGRGFCGVVDHATVSGSGATRLLRLWAIRFEIDPRARERCIPPRRARLVPGGGWNVRTVGWPVPLDPIRPGLPDATPIPFERAVLQPDRRRVLVAYWHGACDALTDTRVRYSRNGRRARITLLFGRTVPADRACPAIAVSGASLIRLPRRANPGTRFIPVRHRAQFPG